MPEDYFSANYWQCPLLAVKSVCISYERMANILLNICGLHHWFSALL